MSTRERLEKMQELSGYREDDEAKGIMLYFNWIELLKSMGTEERHEILDMITWFACGEKFGGDVSEHAQQIFSMMAVGIVKQLKKYNTKEVARANGRKGGRPKKAEPATVAPKLTESKAEPPKPERDYKAEYMDFLAHGNPGRPIKLPPRPFKSGSKDGLKHWSNDYEYWAKHKEWMRDCLFMECDKQCEIQKWEDETGKKWVDRN